MADEERTEPLDRLHAGLAGLVGPLLQPKAGESDLSGQQIGPYKLLQRIGSGGFGDVYMAEQKEPVRRRVALKIIKLGMDTKQVIARFEAERQALAMMDHPNIARVFDAAATDSGRPYFVMELVKGEPITIYCDREKLSITARLAIFSQVCRAVQHAHEKAVIHRDIKPSNVLVTMVDGRPLAKVIDFGIAKATDQRLTEKTVFTAFHQMIGTPEYMSPEQAAGLPDIDTRTDIYSLGVLLYELLTGATPFESGRLRSAAYAEMMRIIREDEPHKPSARLSSLQETRVRTAQQRGEDDPRRLSQRLRGELDWIVMKCLEKDRARRYESAAGLAAEISNYLAGEPVQAAPPSRLYRLQKFVGKHRVSVAACLAIAGTLVVALIATLLGLRSAIDSREAEAIARREAEAAREVASENERKAALEATKSRAALNFVAEMFDSVDPELARGHAVTVAEILNPAAERVAQAFANDAAGEAVVRHVLGKAYANLARYPDARRELERAWELRKTLRQEEDPQAITVLNDLGITLVRAGEIASARGLLEKAYEQRAIKLGNSHRDTLATRSVLAVVKQLQGDLEGALADTRAVLLDQEKHLGPGDRETLESMCSLADMLGRAGRLEEALTAARSASSRAASAFGAEASLALMAGSIEAEMLTELGRYAEAAARLETIAAGKEKLYGREHPSALVTLSLLAQAYGHLHQDDRAVPLCHTIVDRATQSLGERHATTMTYMNNLAQALRRVGDLDQAEPIFRRVIQLRRETEGNDSQELMMVMSNLGLLLMQRDAHAEALPLLREALNGFKQSLPPDHWMLGVALLNLGRCETALRNYAAAEHSLCEAHSLLERMLGAAHARTVQARHALADLYAAWGMPN
ncbi:MAG: serine/threonine-protein kinase [Phycisphaerae bacterium]|nr:serine/threonine-protein kinase [Phycisphaerae bacterium]